MSRHAAAVATGPTPSYHVMPARRLDPAVATTPLPVISPTALPDLTIPPAAGPEDLTGFQAELWEAVSAALTRAGANPKDAPAWAAVRAALPVARRAAAAKALTSAAEASQGSWVHVQTLRALAEAEGER